MAKTTKTQRHMDMSNTFSDMWYGQSKTTMEDIFQMVPQPQLNKLSDYLIQQNGLNYQISMCMDEISELATDLVLDRSFADTASEIADVYITLNHVTYGYDIQRTVNSIRRKKIRAPQFMSGNDERLIALLGLQKELLKHMNRRRDNMPAVINATADAYVALGRLIIAHNNMPLVLDTVYQKIQRTFQREK